MSKTISLKLSSTLPTNTVFQAILDAVNVTQRKFLDTEMVYAGFTYRPTFINDDKNKDENGEKLWSNGTRIVAYDFSTFAVLFGLNGQKSLMLNSDFHEFSASLADTPENKDFLNEVADILRDKIDEYITLDES